ncbi:MAG: putative methyltransferase [Pseudohongiellaceae bacterium]|jgi:predicted methyltransferase
MKNILATVFLIGTAIAGCTNASEAADSAVATPTRPQADKDRDAARKPAQVLEFFGISPGMQVLDVFAGGGYYSEILSHVVGSQGKITLYNNGGWDGFVGAGVAERLENNRLPNVESVVAEANSTEFAANSFDAAIFVLGFHDLYYAAGGWPAIDADAFLADLFESIKPGGVVGIVDHAATLGVSLDVADSLHRIDPSMIHYAMAKAGFKFDGESDILRNSEDDRLKPMSDESIRGLTDRVVYRFIKPAR